MSQFLILRKNEGFSSARGSSLTFCGLKRLRGEKIKQGPTDKQKPAEVIFLFTVSQNFLTQSCPKREQPVPDELIQITDSAVLQIPR